MPDDVKKQKILLVEDDTFMIDLLSNEFITAGYDVSIARTGIEGIAMFQQVKPDLIILDILLPDQNGFETLRQIRRMAGGQAQKAMFLSNLSEGHDIEEAKSLGSLDYLVKANYSLTEILQHVRAALAK